MPGYGGGGEIKPNKYETMTTRYASLQNKKYDSWEMFGKFLLTMLVLMLIFNSTKCTCKK